MKEKETSHRNISMQSRLQASKVYRATQLIAKWMDTFFIDPIVGFFAPGWGDILASVLSIPYLYISVFKIRSLALTLAIVYNFLLDAVVGLVPFLGDFVDLLSKAYQRNYRLIIGFVEGDAHVVQKVNRQAKLSALLIVLLAGVLYLAYTLIKELITWLWGVIF